MGYVIVGGICLLVGALCGVFTLALVSINRNTEIVYPKAEDKIYMGTCSLSATHAVPEEAKDADR